MTSTSGLRLASQTRVLIACLFSAVSLIHAALAEAQRTPGTLSGTVRDSAGRPLENAVIVLDPGGETRATRADAEGRFRFGNIRAGPHELRTTWVGYMPDEREVEVPLEGLDVAIVLAGLPFKLDTLVIVARRSGALGTAVARSSLRALGGAEVEVLGTRLRAHTGADGRFAFPTLREGAHVVSTKRSGFKTRMIPFAVPPNDAVELVVAMDSILSKDDRIIENRFRDLESRLNRRSVPNSGIIPRQELASQRGQRLDLALRYAPSFLHKVMIMSDVECVWVDGRPRPGMLLKDFNVDDIAMVEVYNTRGGGASMADAQEFKMTSGHVGCGAFAELESVPGGAMRSVRRPRIGEVTFVYIWMK